MIGIKKDTDNIVKFRFLKLWLRLLTLILGVAILASNLLGMPSGNYSFVALFFGIVFFIIGLIESSWDFNIDKKEVLYKSGLIFLNKKRRIKFSEINSISVDTFKQPARFSTFTEIHLLLKDGEKLTVERDKTKQLEDQISGMSVIQDIIHQDNT